MSFVRENNFRLPPYITFENDGSINYRALG